MVGGPKFHGPSSQAWVILPRRASEIFVPEITEEEGRPHAARLDNVVAIMLQSVPLGKTSAFCSSTKPPYPLSAEAQEKAIKFTLSFVGNEPVKRRGISGGISGALTQSALGKGSHIMTPFTPSLEAQYTPGFSLNIFKCYPHLSPPGPKKTPDAGPIFRYRIHCQSVSSQRLRSDHPGQ